MTPTKDTSKPLTPKLRFSGFSGVWEEKRLKEFFIKKTKKNTEGNEHFVLTNSATQGIVGQLDYFDKDIANQNNLLGYYEVDVDDFVYNPRISKHAPVGPLKRNSYRKGVMSPLYTVLKPKVDFLDFLEKYFNTKNWHRYMSKIANYGARHDRMNIAQEDFMRMPILAPSLLEQQRIASFLSSIDDWIENLKKQKENLEAYKKGMMQKIFRQEVRFPGFSGEWEEKRGGDVFENYTNKNHSGDLPLLAATQDNGIMYRDDLDLKINSSVEGIKSYKIIEPGNFVISLRSFQGGIEYSRIKGISSPAYTVLRKKIDINDDFYRILFKKEDFINRLSSLIYGIRDGKQISYKEFKTLKLPFPSLPEQQKIADFFTALDNQITAKQTEIDKAEEWKKGVMQGVFV